MGGISVEEELKMLYHTIELAGTRPRMEDLAKRMGLKKEATAWRYNKLMKRLEAEINGATPPNTTAARPKTSGGVRKQASDAKKRKANGSDVEDDGGLAGANKKPIKFKANESCEGKFRKKETPEWENDVHMVIDTDDELGIHLDKNEE